MGHHHRRTVFGFLYVVSLVLAVPAALITVLYGFLLSLGPHALDTQSTEGSVTLYRGETYAVWVDPEHQHVRCHFYVYTGSDLGKRVVFARDFHGTGASDDHLVRIGTFKSPVEGRHHVQCVSPPSRYESFSGKAINVYIDPAGRYRPLYAPIAGTATLFTLAAITRSRHRRHRVTAEQGP